MVALLCGFLLALPLAAQTISASTSTVLAPALPVTFQTDDGWTLSGELRPPQEGRDVVVLIHSLKGDRKEWTSFAARLARLGFGTLAFDLRGYGLSTKGPYGPETYRDFDDMEWPKAVKDVDAAIAFLTAQGIPEDRLALAGAVVGANIAAMAAAAHPKLSWMILLSPGNDYHGLSVGEGGQIDTLLAASQDDPDSLAVCQGLVDLDESRTLVIAQTGRGMAMFDDKSVRKQVMDWIRRQAP